MQRSSLVYSYLQSHVKCTSVGYFIIPAWNWSRCLRLNLEKHNFDVGTLMLRYNNFFIFSNHKSKLCSKTGSLSYLFVILFSVKSFRNNLVKPVFSRCNCQRRPTHNKIQRMVAILFFLAEVKRIIFESANIEIMFLQGQPRNSDHVHT